MTTWLVRAGRTGDREDLALEMGVAVLGWDAIPDLSSVQTKEQLSAIYQKNSPDAGSGRAGNHVGQLWTFSHRIKQGDLVVLPLKRRSAIAVGQVIGPYAYRTDLGDAHHTLPVKWVATDLPRSAFDRDILHSLGAFMTVCEIKRNDAENRIRAVLKAPAPSVSVSGAEPTVESDDEAEFDVEDVARSQISDFISRRFAGHEMARLVEAVLRADGYVTERADPGADGGVDILAGRGELGFGSPRLCVQVKSQQSPVDVTIFRGLQGSMQTFSADQGLLVCWGGFKRSVLAEARASFFKVRLWDAGDLVDALLRNYSRLPKDVQAELPLKQVWALVMEE
jgi:restriction system protein